MAEPISEGERQFVHGLLMEKKDRCCLLEWATKLRRQKVQKRLLVVGEYRVYSIKRTSNGKKSLQREGLILEIKTLELTDNPDEIILYWTDFNIHVLTPNAYNVAQLVRSNFQKYSCGFPEMYQIQLKINDPSRLPELDPPEYTPAGGFRLTYAARCNQLMIPTHEPLVILVEDLAAQGVRTLNLSACPGIETLDLRAVTMALLHNIYFTGLQLSGVKRPEALQEFGWLIAVNRTLIELTLDGTTPIKGAVSALGDSLVKNPSPSLEVLNLKGDRISEEEGMKLGLGIAAYKHFLTGLDLTQCGLQGRGVIGIFAGLAANRNVCTYLRVLKVSHNKLGGGQGSVELARFFDRYAIGNEPRSLEVLHLENCNLDQVVVSALVRRDGVVATLKEINLASNNLSGPVGPSLVAMAKDSQSLRTVNFSNTKIDLSTVEAFLRACGDNEFLSELNIDLSHNVLRIHGADSIDRGLRNHVDKIRSMNLFNTSLNEDGLLVILKVFENSPTIHELDLGANIVKQRGGKGMQGCLTNMSMFVAKHRALRVLRLGGQLEGKLYMGKYMAPLLSVFSNSSSLEELDISGNLTGDETMVVLFDALRVNSSLRYLYWDGNNTTPGSWSALVRTLKENVTLVHVEYPAKDVETFAPRGRRGDRQRVLAESLMTDVNKLLRRNVNGGEQQMVGRVRGQTFNQGMQQDTANYQQSVLMASPRRSPRPNEDGLQKSPRPGGDDAPGGTFRAPPRLNEAYPQGSPLELEQRRRAEQEAALQRQRQEAAQPVRNMAPPPTMERFQAANRPTATSPGMQRQPTGQIARGSPTTMRQPQYAQQQQQPPPPHYQQQQYAQPYPQQQQYAQSPQQRQYAPPPQQHYQQQPPRAAQHPQHDAYAHQDYNAQYDVTDQFATDAMDDLPPPPPLGDSGYQEGYTEDGAGYYETDYQDLPPPPPPAY